MLHMGERDTKAIFTAADAIQAEAIRSAMLQAGIEADVLAEETRDGRVVLTIRVPLGCETQARELITQGNWPRLA
jgi:hypothetical protein